MDTLPSPSTPDNDRNIPEAVAVEPSWWRLGWVPYASLVLAAAAADFLAPRFYGLGLAACIGVILLMSALLLLRRDLSKGEQVFLILLTIVCCTGLLLGGSVLCWVAALAVPFAMLSFLPGKESYSVTTKFLNWWQFWFSHRIRAEVESRAGRIKQLLPTLLSIFVGIVCFVFFLCIFASGNPVVQVVWDAIANTWNSLVEFLNLDWTFWLHAICWVVGVMGFGIYTLRRPSAVAPEQPTVVEVEPKKSILPYLAPSMLIGTNLAFLIATSTDVAFLWLHNVPEGISQTDYLYDGAASISWASAIAAGLLLVLFRPNGSSRRSTLSRTAGYVLLVQTFMLAVSVYMRLYNQVDAYGFTARRVLAAETMLFGVAGLVFLLFYMHRRVAFMRLLRPAAGTVLLLALLFSSLPPQLIAGRLNMRFVETHPHWNFTANDFGYRKAFDVKQNLAFAWYVYQNTRDERLLAQIDNVCLHLTKSADKRTWHNYSVFTSSDAELARVILEQLDK